MTGAVLELTDVSRHYGTPAVAAVDRVSLRIGPGERVALVGASGSGKSTLLHVMGTLDHPTAGTVFVAGHEVSRVPDRRLAALRATFIGFVFQQFFLLEHRTALDNVATGLLDRRAPRTRRKAAALEALDRVGLADRRDHLPTHLSGGERQRVAIARALVGRPRVVLADEPTGNLDSVASAGVLELLAELNRDGTTVVVVTHDPLVAQAMDRRVEMHDGQIVSDA
jgi:putative ABC transport system ATP-binding protein